MIVQHYYLWLLLFALGKVILLTNLVNGGAASTTPYILFTISSTDLTGSITVFILDS